MGNVGSIRNMFHRIGVSAEITSTADAIAGAEKLILPGVGSFDAGMSSIQGCGLREVLDRKALEDRVPVLGICLGAQLMTLSSEEGSLPGLGWIRARTTRFPSGNGCALKVPHMGWNGVAIARPSPLTMNLGNEPRFYFVHSYFIRVENEEDAILKTTYGLTFDSGVQSKNIFGLQFHPEKSHKYGMGILEAFARL